ncbi:MAG TPA: cupin, partial [Thiocapsa sp.]|nr:cupin [Thiocapsa sp.]
MSELRIHAEDRPVPEAVFNDFADIRRELGAIGVNFERWQADRVLAVDATPDDVIAAYRGDIDRLKTDYGFGAVDVLRMTPDHPDREALRAKFLNEHT